MGLQRQVMINKSVGFFFENVTDAIDKGKPFDCIYFDFTKAFDKDPHLMLIKQEMPAWKQAYGEMQYAIKRSLYINKRLSYSQLYSVSLPPFCPPSWNL